jgi:predicted ATPase
MFALCAPADVAVERTHFHDFMLDVHKRLHRSESKADPLDAVSKDIVREGKGRNKVLVLCLDEFMVTDVADGACVACRRSNLRLYLLCPALPLRAACSSPNPP